MPSGTTTLEFDYRAVWELFRCFGVPPNCATVPRTFEVHIEPVGGGIPLQTYLILNALNGGFEEDTDNPSGGGPPYPDGIVDLSAFAGQDVRLKFVWNVPEPGTGFAFFQLDNVSLNFTVMPATDIGITAVDAPASVTEGDITVVTVTVQNLGNQDVASNIEVSLAADVGGGTVTNTPQTIVGGLTNGESRQLLFNWDSTGATTGVHALTAGHDFVDDDVASDILGANVTVNAAPSAFDVTGISPTQMPIGGMIQLTVSGTGFVNPASITFASGSGPAPVASAVNAIDGNTITAMVTVGSKGPKKDRVWDMDVVNGDGDSETLVQAFTVTNGGGTGNNAPSAMIISPADGDPFASGAVVNFSGSASDDEDGDLTASLSWTSNIDGNLGAGGAISFALSDGVHTITASVTDSGGLAGSDTITITVGDPGVTVTSINPNQIQADPNQQVTISDVVIQGTGFVAGAIVTFEGGPASGMPTATEVLVASDSEIVLDVTVPPISKGPKKRTRDVRVTNSVSSTGVLAGGFTVNR